MPHADVKGCEVGVCEMSGFWRFEESLRFCEELRKSPAFVLFLTRLAPAVAGAGRRRSASAIPASRVNGLFLFANRTVFTDFEDESCGSRSANWRA